MPDRTILAFRLPMTHIADRARTVMGATNEVWRTVLKPSDYITRTVLDYTLI